MPAYAQLNDANEVVAVTQTAEPVFDAKMIWLPEMEPHRLGQTYLEGAFSTPAPPP